MNHEVIEIMDRLEVQSALSKGAAEAWKTSHLRDSQGDIVSWLPITSLNSQQSPIGLSADGYWVISAKDNTVVELLEGKPPVFLLPALERPYSEMVELIKTALEALKLPSQLIEWFPVEEIIILGLTGGLDYWADLALNWLEVLPLNERIVETLKNTTNAKWASQGVRQRAQRLARRWTPR
jgi:hypothetical protein